MLSVYTIQWMLLLAFGVLFFFLAPLSKTKNQFFNAVSNSGKQPGFLLLTSSLVISWIFAKSITNAANLGLAYGFVGGVGYAVYYLSFLVAGLIIYKIRTKGGFKSIHEFLQTKFGRGAVLVFSLLIGIRLFNEVWSNSMVIGSYFGEAGSSAYYMAILGFTVLTLAYVIKGGLRSSLLTDAIQMIFFGLLLVILLGIILPSGKETTVDYVTSGTWSMATGGNLVLLAFLQIFSYPFHDSVLTDRAFIGKPKVTRNSFLLASIIGFACIVLFSLVGVYGKFNSLEGQAAVEVGKLLGVVVMLGMNFIMITSAASTLDSAFASFSKLVVLDLGKKAQQTISRGRWMMILIAVIGTIPVFFNPEILSATTISGTMVMGLAPIFIFWHLKAPKLSFHLPIWFGVFMGIIVATKCYPNVLLFSEGKYAADVSANLYGIIICFVLYLVPYFVVKWRTNK